MFKMRLNLNLFSTLETNDVSPSVFCNTGLHGVRYVHTLIKGQYKLPQDVYLDCKALFFFVLECCLCLTGR